MRFRKTRGGLLFGFLLRERCQGRGLLHGVPPPPGWTVEEGRIGSEALHQHLDTLGVPHEYEVPPGVTHAFPSLWHYGRPDRLVRGLHELPYHARAWEEGE